MFYSGLGFRPMPPEANLGSTLIWYKASKPENMEYWFKTLDKFLEGKYKIIIYTPINVCVKCEIEIVDLKVFYN